jgi:uncharacterized membrane protein (UPF0182 family)
VEFGGRPRGASRWTTPLIVVAVLLLVFARGIAGFVIEWAWWKQLGQLDTYLAMLSYGSLPVLAAGALAFLVLWTIHARALKFAGTGLARHRGYGFLSSLVLLVVAMILAGATIDSWTVVRFAGNWGVASSGGWIDPVFGKPLSFYLFDLPFLLCLRNYLMALLVISGLVFWLAARVWQVIENAPRMGEAIVLEDLFQFSGALESRFLRALGALFLLGLAVNAWLGRYAMLWTDHDFMVGMNWVDLNIRLPIAWLLVAGCLLGAAAIAAGRFKWAFAVVVLFLIQGVVPGILSAVYVRPNEIAIERPYIQRHIEATRDAYGLNQRARDLDFKVNPAEKLDLASHEATISNVRLWDWRAFHDTVTQIQTLRPYYVFNDTDVDRYLIDGKLRQVMLSPRELDINQLRDAQSRWVNPHFIYTHSYGLVMAESNEITADGLPILFVKDAPPVVESSTLKLTRPEIYFGEVVHEPVFVRSGQQEFNYPSGQDNVFSRYEGEGGIPVGNPLMKLAAAIWQADYNILLTSLIQSDTQMMIRRNVRDRVEALAGFITWDRDPYLVLTEQGHLVWTIDGYTTSSAHPYSQSIRLGDTGGINYIRNAVKATVDAYTGKTTFYVFDDNDPIIRAYWNLFPALFQPASAMPADLRAHARYPELLFLVQAQIFRNYHMRDPQAFYNKEDAWDIARNVQGQDGSPQPLSPVYIVGSLPGENKPEFLLLLPFTPRNKDNLVGMMVARCDGENLGELVFLTLSKQELVFGPMQVEARINQDQNISKDLSLWNQQGSRVLRGQILTLPIGSSVLYVESIYIQAAEARMPQLKKVVLSLGNELVYQDTYEQAVAELSQRIGLSPSQTRTVSATIEMRTEAPGGIPGSASTGAQEPSLGDGPLRTEIRTRFANYRRLVSEGKWAEAGRELEAIEALVKRN